MRNDTHAESYPLSWPDGWPRTMHAEKSRFKTSMAMARKNLVNELGRLGARNVVVSSNVPLRQDGLPYASFKIPADVGVAVYFQYKDKPMTFACDRWNSVVDNLDAIGKTIEALRGIDRWGASDMMERAFSGFFSLPPAGSDWWNVLNICRSSSLIDVTAAYKRLVRIFHPDNGSSPNVVMMQKINQAISEARAEKDA